MQVISDVVLSLLSGRRIYVRCSLVYIYIYIYAYVYRHKLTFDMTSDILQWVLGEPVLQICDVYIMSYSTCLVISLNVVWFRPPL